jgi:hypothetical protein
MARHAFHLHPASLGKFMLRVGNTVLQLPVVGQRQQSFAVGIQPPGRIIAGKRDIIGKCRMSAIATELADHAKWFVE